MGILGCCGLLSVSAYAQVVVRMETNLGNIDVELYDEAAPITVDNFLNYVDSGRYNGTFIHRSEPGFIIQGGGYSATSISIEAVTTDPPIVNEYDPSRSNLRGTITMAKVGGDPNSATSEWFFNLADNSANLDFQNGGFTVFGRVLRNGMDVVDAIANLGIVNCGAPFDEWPLINLATCPNAIPIDHLVTISRIWKTPDVQGNQAIMVDNAGNVVSLTAVAPATLSNVAVSDNPSPTNVPDDVTFQEGFFSFQVDGLTPGGSTMIAMRLPAGYVPNTYYMYGPTSDNHNPHWYEFEFDGQTGAEFFGNNFVVLNFVDGERGDADLIANGQISDPGAPGISTATTPAPSSSGGGGGCTLSTQTSSSSWRGDLWLIALGLMAYLLNLSLRPESLPRSVRNGRSSEQPTS